MFESLQDLSSYLKYGSYQIISRIRIEYAYKNPQLKDDISINYCNGKSRDTLSRDTLSRDTLSSQQELFDDFLTGIDDSDSYDRFVDTFKSKPTKKSTKKSSVKKSNKKFTSKKSSVKKSSKKSTKKSTKKSSKKSRKSSKK